MPFDHVRGQDTAVATLVRALERGRVHHAYRFEGPEGVGKELVAFALAQALVCAEGETTGCGRCGACRRAVQISEAPPRVPLHPDVILVERGLYPAASIGRSRDEISDISVDQIRRIVLAHAPYTPHEAPARLFIVRRAEEMSASAANALLKTLEEPRPGTHFVLLTSSPDRLLPTIRSRTLPVRFRPLSEAVLRPLLEARGVPAERQELALELSGGSARAALDLTEPERSQERESFVEGVFAALHAPDLGKAVALAEARDKEGTRLDMRDDLRALAATLARSARQCVFEDPEGAARIARHHQRTLWAIEHLERNASPVLSLASLVSALRDAR